MNRHQLLAGLHERLRPRTYVEIGVNDGQSLRLSRAPSVGVDPEFAVSSEIQADVHLARTSSDAFFARRYPLAHLPHDEVDLCFVDGMHLAEYALRDFLAVERFTHPGSVVLLDDMLPRSVAEADRKRRTRAWAGDVYKAAAALRTFRPDLLVLDVDTKPTGTTVVLLPDAGHDGVLAEYDDWLDDAVVPDPQQVPAEVLDRRWAWDPTRLLADVPWSRLRDVRGVARDLARARATAALATLRQREDSGRAG